MIEVKETLENFADIPSSGLQEISSISEMTDSEIFNTGAGAEDIDTGEQPSRDKKGKVNVNKDAPSSPTKLGSVVGGELGVRLIDLAIPAILVTALHYIGYKLAKEKLKFNSEDRKALAPVLQDCLNAIEIDFNNPFTNLGFVLSVIYATKIIEEIPNIEKVDRRKKPQVKEEIETVEEIKEEKFSDNGINFSPETRFKNEWNELLDRTMKSTGRKSRKGAIGFLYKNEPALVKELLDKYNFSEPPNDADFNWTKKKSPTVNFEL